MTHSLGESFALDRGGTNAAALARYGKIAVHFCDTPRGGPAALRMSHDDFPGWSFRLVLTGAGAVVDFAMSWDGGDIDPVTGLPPTLPTGRRWRDVPVGDFVAAARLQAEAIQDVARQVAARRGQDLTAWSPWASETQVPPRKPGPDETKVRSEYDYAVLAKRYVERCAQSRRPVADLAAAEHLSTSQMRNLLYAKARDRYGLLTSDGQGRAGGQLTDRARYVLAHPPTTTKDK